MDHRFRWVALLAMVLVAFVVGSIAYNAGVSHGLAIGAPAAGGAPAAANVYYGHRHWGPWGFGFGPFAFVLLWILLIRGLFWGGGWRRRWWYTHGPYDAPPSFEEWHRRAHERMNAPTGQPQA